MRVPYLVRLFIDNLLGFHDECVCQYADYPTWEDGKVTSLYVNGVKFVPEVRDDA